MKILSYFPHNPMETITATTKRILQDRMGIKLSVRLPKTGSLRNHLIVCSHSLSDNIFEHKDILVEFGFFVVDSHTAIKQL